MYSVMFVCSGNRCRSPMAEVWFRRLVEQENLAVEVSSAGIIAGDGMAAHEHAQLAVAAEDLSLDDFSSQELTLARVHSAQLIVTMSRSLVEQVCRVAPAAEAKTISLMQAVGSDEDVADPLGEDPAAYKACLDYMKPALQALLERVRGASSCEDSKGMTEITDFTKRPYSLLVGSDHGGFELKQALVRYLLDKGLELKDLGPNKYDPKDDYPYFAGKLAAAVARSESQAGILICRSGIGMSINANRFHNVRAALATSPAAAKISRSHNCSNVLVTGGDNLNPEELFEIVDAWLATPFSGEERHRRRLRKVEENSTDETAAIRATDFEIAGWIDREAQRQTNILELIASENMVSPAVRAAAGSCLTNKYAEGYPQKRYYGGCQYVDEIERIAIERACELFGAEAANVQPHSGSQANMAVYFALLEPGDTVLAMSVAHGGHLTHGLKVNFSGRFFNFVGYGVDRKSEMLDYDEIARLAKKHKPKLLLAGASSYPRFIDFARLREIADHNAALLVVDMAHVAGLVAGGVHPNPVPYCDVVTSTTHKTLRGPRSGLILCKESYLKKINSQIFPGIQGGPLMHVIAAKAVCFKEAMNGAFKAYAKQIVQNAAALAAALSERGLRIVSGGTDNHLMLVDLRPMGVSGQQAETALDEAGITVNKNLIPFDPEKPTVTSGMRLGTPTVTTRGMKEAEMARIAEWIHRVISNIKDELVRPAVRMEIEQFTQDFPVP